MEFNGTFIISAISFIVFVFVMNAIFYKPLEDIVNERKKFIDGNYNEAKFHKDQSEKLLKDKEEKLSKAATDAKKIMVEKTEASKVQKETMASEVRTRTIAEVKQAKDELFESSNEAKNVLKPQVVELARNISNKILGEESELKNVNQELIEKIMQEG